MLPLVSIAQPPHQQSPITDKQPDGDSTLHPPGTPNTSHQHELYVWLSPSVCAPFTACVIPLPFLSLPSLYSLYVRMCIVLPPQAHTPVSSGTHRILHEGEFL